MVPTKINSCIKKKIVDPKKSSEYLKKLSKHFRKKNGRSNSKAIAVK